MKKYQICVGLILLLVLTGCSNDHFDAVDPHQSFIASVNILEPSLVFYDSTAKEIANWPLEKPYTGAILVDYDAVLLFGHQLDEADLYELSSGKLIKKIETGIGVTNAYYDEQSKIIFMTNSKTNELSSYTIKGELQQKLKLGNYPMSMIAQAGNLYVINYKDTLLSVVSIESLQQIDEWEIPKSSHGLHISDEANEIWLGGHGEGSRPNDLVRVYDLTTGQLKSEIITPLMPVGFSQNEEEVAIVSHGTNQIYGAKLNGEVVWQQEIGANPFAVAHFKEQLVVAGYDDQYLYFLKDQQIQHQVKTGKGPFQLLVRER